MAGFWFWWPLYVGCLYHLQKAFKLVRDCGKTPFGVQSDHDAILAKLHLNSIAFKHVLSVGVIDWKTIYENEKKERTEYNDKLYNDTIGASYTEFMEAINPAAAAAAATKKRYVNKDWFTFWGEEPKTLTRDRDKLISKYGEIHEKITT